MQNRQNRIYAPGAESRAPVNATAVLHRIVHSSDPSEFELALQPWDLLCQPTSAGRFSHRIHAFATEDFLLYREHYDLGVKLRGLTPDGMLLIGVPVAQGKASRFWGKTQPEWKVPFSLPSYVRGNLAPGYEQLVAGISVDRLRKAMSAEAYATLEYHARSHVITCDTATRQRLCDWVSSGLQRLLVRSRVMYHPGYAAAMFDDLLAIFVGISERIGDASAPKSTPKTQRGFERALEFMRTAKIEDVRLSRLCEVSSISERSLRYAFRDKLDMSPVEFIIRRRLHAARRALLRAEASSALVSRVATEHGFYELGRFAGRYFSEFGELPSETLKRVG